MCFILREQKKFVLFFLDFFSGELEKSGKKGVMSGDLGQLS